MTVTLPHWSALVMCEHSPASPVSLATLAVMLAFCGCKEPMSTETCELRAESISVKLSRFTMEPRTEMTAQTKLPRSSRGQRISMPGPVLAVTAAEITLDGVLQQSLPHLQTTLAERAQSDQANLFLQVEGTASVLSLIAILRAIPEGFVPQLVVAEPKNPDAFAEVPAAAKSILERIDQSDDSAERSRSLASEIHNATRGCPELHKGLAASAKAPAAQKAQLLIQSVEEGLVGCKCRVDDLKTLEVLLLATLHSGDQLRAIPLYTPGTEVAVSPDWTVEKLLMEAKPELPWSLTLNDFLWREIHLDSLARHYMYHDETRLHVVLPNGSDPESARLKFAEQAAASGYKLRSVEDSLRDYQRMRKEVDREVSHEEATAAAPSHQWLDFHKPGGPLAEVVQDFSKGETELRLAIHRQEDGRWQFSIVRWPNAPAAETANAPQL